MTINTPNLGLVLYDKNEDPDMSFQEYRIALNGPTNTNSNMTKIEIYSTTFVRLLAGLTSSISGSIAIVNASITSASASVGFASGSVTEIDSRLEQLGEFSGSGTADFTSISSSYTHLIITGTVHVNYSGCPLVNLGIDFNGDSGSSNYSAVQWSGTGSKIQQLDDVISNRKESNEIYNTAQIVIGKVSGSSASDGGYSNFIAIVPYYSGSSALWKTAMGLSMGWGLMKQAPDDNYNIDWVTFSNQGGYWLSTAPITRIRVFGSVNTTTRYGFHDGSKITLYGLK